ncbi:putative motility protein [Oxalobacteraceae bacterium CAVE-383]|nr:putative motility protein [Oxalobacteraceae bacterium CAVE-383]
MSDVTNIATLATSNTVAGQSVAVQTMMQKHAMNAQKTLAEGLIAAIPPSPTGSLGHNINTVA